MAPNFKAFDPTSKTYFKRNFDDALEKIVPTVYSIKDTQVSGLEHSPIDLLLETHIQAAKYMDQLLPISATLNFSSISSISGIYPYFVKQNDNTRVTPFYFERDILDPLNFQLEAFDTSTEWKSYLDKTLLPALRLNNPAQTVLSPKGTSYSLSAAYGVSGASGVHEYLINTLGWMYFLNTSAPTGGTYDPSTYVSERLTSLFLGGETHTLEGVKGFQEFLWKNYLKIDNFQRKKLIPPNYVSGANTSTFTSGTQNLDRLKTLVDVLYSPLYADRSDFKVKEAFENYITYGEFSLEEVQAGPFAKLLRTLGYSYQDLNSPVEELEALYDIDNCPDRFLPHLSDLIGWELIGADPAKWRNQLRNAVRIYKAKGTAYATQLLLNTIFGENSTFNLSGQMYELHETFVPNIIYYLLAVATPHFNKAGYKDDPFENWTIQDAFDLGVTHTDGDGQVKADWTPSSVDSNIRRCVDNILLEIRKAHPNNFYLGDSKWPPVNSPNFVFDYRGRTYPMPPFEEVRWYEKVSIGKSLLGTLKTQLQRFSVTPSSIDYAIKFIGDRSLSSTDDISIDNKFVLYTSGFETPLNFEKILKDISNKRASYLPLWSGKSSHFDLHLSADSFNFDEKAIVPDASLGIEKALIALNKTIPAHAIPRVKMFLTALDEVQAFLYACPRPMHTPEDFFTESTVVNAWSASGVNMGAFFSELGLGHGISSTGNSREYVNSITDMLMDGSGGDHTKVATVPRNNLRRRTFHTTLPRNGYYSRTGQNMPSTYAPSTPSLDVLGVSGGGALSLGYNYSGCGWQTPFTTGNVSSLHPVWNSCETSSSQNTFFGVDTSNTFNWRGTVSVLSSMMDAKCLLHTRRDECPEVIRIMHSTLEKDALRNAYAEYKNVSGDWALSNTYMDPIQSLANSAFNGVSSWNQYADYTFGSGVQEVYNRYAREFGRHGTAPYLVSGIGDHGGKNIFAHIYGPLVYNGRFSQDGSATTMVASAFDQENFTGVTSAVLYDSGASATWGTGNLIIGKGATGRGEYRYPYALSGVEFCYRSHITNAVQPSFKTYRLAVPYIDDNPGLGHELTNEAVLEIDAQNESPIITPRLRFDLRPYGDSAASGNLLLPEHDFNLMWRAAKMGETPGKVWVWIHTMPENGIFWSWRNRPDWSYTNKAQRGEWIPSYVSSLESVPVAQAYSTVKEELSTEFTPPGTQKTNIEDLVFSDFNYGWVFFNTHNKQNRLSSNFRSLPEEYPHPFVHRTDQHYVIEVLFDAPMGNTDLKYVIPAFRMVDKTLASTSLDEFIIDWDDSNGVNHNETITRTGVDEYRGIFKYMNSLAASSLGQGYATRIAADSSGIFEASGGSRLNYRYHPKWDATTRGAIDSTDNYTIIDFKEGS